jgi:hypothetical protein
MYHPPNNSKFETPRFKHMASYPLIAASTETLTKTVMSRKLPVLTALMRLFPNGPGMNMIRYICLTYDRQSPFKAEFHSLKERKAAVAAFCNFKEGQTEQYYEMLVNLSNEGVVDALCDFLKFQNDLTWSMIIQYEEVFLSNQRQIFLGISNTSPDKDRMTASLNASKLADVNKSLVETIAGLYVKFTGNDPDAEVAIKERAPLRPEMVADFVLSDNYEPEFLTDEEE